MVVKAMIAKFTQWILAGYQCNVEACLLALEKKNKCKILQRKTISIKSKRSKGRSFPTEQNLMQKCAVDSSDIPIQQRCCLLLLYLWPPHYTTENILGLAEMQDIIFVFCWREKFFFQTPQSQKTTDWQLNITNSKSKTSFQRVNK